MPLDPQLDPLVQGNSGLRIPARLADLEARLRQETRTSSSSSVYVPGPVTATPAGINVTAASVYLTLGSGTALIALYMYAEISGSPGIPAAGNFQMLFTQEYPAGGGSFGHTVGEINNTSGSSMGAVLATSPAPVRDTRWITGSNGIGGLVVLPFASVANNTYRFYPSLFCSANNPVSNIYVYAQVLG